jgi:hypothetical protein
MDDGFSSQLANYKDAKLLEEERGYYVANTHERIITQCVYELTF